MDWVCKTVEFFLAIFGSPEFWKILIPTMLALVLWLSNERSKRKWEEWQAKKVVCLNALNVANAIISNRSYPNVKLGDLVPQYESIESIRSCMNELACLCHSPAVLDNLKIILHESVSPDAIVDLREAVRKELGWDGPVIDSDRDKAFLGRVNCDPRRVPTASYPIVNLRSTKLDIPNKYEK